MNMNIVIALGGSVVNPDSGTLNVAPYAEAIERIVEVGHSVSVVVGGGATARTYIESAREFESSESALDRLGIAASRLNANLLVEAFDASYGATFRATPEAVEEDTLDVLGGTVPGHTTDAVAGLVAEELGADTVVFVTSTDGVYDSDPSENEDAERYRTITYDDLVTLIAGSPRSAGSPAPIDLLAVKILQRSGIDGIVIEGRDGAAVRETVLDDSFTGTVIRGD